jgi:hypothetical protein
LGYVLDQHLSVDSFSLLLSHYGVNCSPYHDGLILLKA